MEEQKNVLEERILSIDFSYMLKNIKRNLVYLILTGFIVSAWFYMVWNQTVEDTYSTKMDIAVISKDNTISNLSEYNVNSVMNRCVSTLNSELLRRLVKEDLKDNTSMLNYSAERVKESNIIEITAMAGNAEDSYRILMAVINNYPQVSTFATGNYLMKNVGLPSAERVEFTSNKSILYSGVIGMLVLLMGLGLTGISVILSGKLQNSYQVKKNVDMNYLGTLHYEKKNGKKGLLIKNPTTSFHYCEEMDKISVMLLRKLKAGQPKTIMITSVAENEGKSTVAANLALKMAEVNLKVLLIDIDFMKPSLYKLFEKDISEEKDFTRVLKGEADMKEVMEKDEENGFFYAFMKAPLEEESYVLLDRQLKAFIKNMKNEMDYIIVDVPPIGICREVELIAEAVDETLFIIRQNTSPYKIINDYVDVLDQADAHVMGCIFNAVHSKSISDRRIYGCEYEKYYKKAY